MTAYDLRKTIGPARRNPVRGRGIDHAGHIIGDQRDRLARRIIGQAKDRDIGGVQRAGARLRILALGIIQHDQAELTPPRQPVSDFEASRPRRAVDKDLGRHQAERSHRQIADKPVLALLPQPQPPEMSSRLNASPALSVTMTSASARPAACSAAPPAPITRGTGAT